MRVLIAGGGVSGLATAVALRRAGVEALVFERVPDARAAAVGAAVHLWSNAMLALQHLGLDEAAKDVSAPITVQEFCTRDGKLLTTWPIEQWEREIGQPTIGITRTALHGVLADALDADTIHFGTEVVDVRDDGDGVTASFADGSEEHGDVLLGADGINSAIRRHLFPDAQRRYAESCWRTVVDLDGDLARSGVFRILHGPGERFLFYPVGGGQMLWLAAAHTDPAVEAPEQNTKDALLARFGSMGAPAYDLIAATEADTVRRTDLYELHPPLPEWSTGRIGLIGDAGHGMTVNIGQGACQAIEDSVVLARHLARASDPAAALRAFAAERRGRVASLATISRRVGSLNSWSSPVGVRMRELAMRTTFGQAAKNFRKTLGYDAAEGRSVLPA